MSNIESTRSTGGRPTKYTPRVVKTILRCVRRGLPLMLAAQAAGVSYATLLYWRNNNSKFAEALERAVARGADARLRGIEAAAKAGDWRAQAWLLEHTLPQHFAKSRLEVTGAGGAPLMAGVTLYLPTKGQSPGPVVEMPEVPALEEGKTNGNH